MKVVFKNLEKSEFILDTATKRANSIISKFPNLNKRDLSLTLSKDTSPTKGGSGVFKVKLQVLTGEFRGIVLEKSSSNLYKALAKTVDKTHERLTRLNSKKNQLKTSFNKDLAVS